jgi:hypothetical protein
VFGAFLNPVTAACGAEVGHEATKNVPGTLVSPETCAVADPHRLQSSLHRPFHVAGQMARQRPGREDFDFAHGRRVIAAAITEQYEALL